MIPRIFTAITVFILTLALLVGCRAQGSDAFTVTPEQAKRIALEDAGLTAEQVTWLRTEPDRENGKVVYDVSFRHGNTEYEYDIDAVTGGILYKDIDNEGAPAPATVATTASTSSPTTTTTAVSITADEAQAIALADAGLTAEQVDRLYTVPDRDDGRSYYDVSFYHGDTEYEYTIDAVTGTIAEADRDKDGPF